MSWFINYYKCAHCRTSWTDEWSATCDDDCTQCGARHMSPIRSADLTEIIVKGVEGFAALRSSDEAEHEPQYRLLGVFRHKRAARKFLADYNP